MKFCEIQPFVRYARRIVFDGRAAGEWRVAYDARLFYVADGEGAVSFEDRTLSLRKGSALLIAAGIPYHLRASQEARMTCLAFNFDYTQRGNRLKLPIVPAEPGSFRAELMHEQITFDDETQLGGYLLIPSAETVERRCTRLVEEYRGGLLFSEVKTGALLAEVLVELVRRKRTAGTQEKDTVRAVIDYIGAHCTENVTNRHLAEHFGFHPVYLSALVREAVGMPMHKYLLHMRILHAAALLETGAHSVRQVAELCGFCDVYYFTRCFRLEMGITPAAFSKGRKNAEEKEG